MSEHSSGEPNSTTREPAVSARASDDDEATQEVPRFTRPPHQPPSAPPTAGVPDDQATTQEAGQFTRPPQQPASVPPPAGWPRGPVPQQPNPGQAPPWVAGGGGQRHAGPASVYPPYAAAPSGQFRPPGPSHPGHPPASAPKSALKSALADRRWWAAGGAVAVVVILGSVAVAVNGGSDDAASGPASTTAAQVPAAPVTTMQSEPPPPAPPPPPPAPPAPTLAAEALPGLLLSAEQVSQRLNWPGMTATAVESNPLEGTITPANCSSSFGPAYAPTYNGSGFTGLAVQGVFAQPKATVAQAVVAFPDPAAAKSFLDKQSADWSTCKSSLVTWSYRGQSSEVDIGVPAMTGDVMTVGLTSRTSTVVGQKCERALTVRGNVIVDVRACSPTMNSGGYNIASDIAAKIR